MTAHAETIHLVGERDRFSPLFFAESVGTQKRRSSQTNSSSQLGLGHGFLRGQEGLETAWNILELVFTS
jgi:hypothetical protein